MNMISIKNLENGFGDSVILKNISAGTDEGKVTDWRYYRVKGLIGCMRRMLLIIAALLAVPADAALLNANDSLINKSRVAAFVGTVCDKYVEKKFPDASIVYVNSEAELFMNVRSGKAGYAVLGTEFRGQVAKENPDFETKHITSDVNDMAKLGFAFSKSRADLLKQFNEFLTEIKNSGELDSIIDGWRYGFENMPAPKITNDGSSGVIRFATTGNEIPNTAIRNGELVGFDIDIMHRFANRRNYRLDISKYSFSGIVPAIASGKADMAAAGMAITEERAKLVDFSDPYSYIAYYIVGLIGDGGEKAWTDFIGKRIGVVTGSICDQITENHVKGIPVFYTDMPPAIEDIRKGRIDGFMIDLSISVIFAASPSGKNLRIIEIPPEIFKAPMGAISVNPDIIEKFNVFLDKIRDDGTLRDMQGRWLNKVPDLHSPMPDIPLTGASGILKVATDGTQIPFSYISANDEFKGYSIELARRFAAHEGMDIEFTNINFGGLIPYVISKKADFAIANISITEERKKSVLFTESIYDDQLAIIALEKQNQTAPGKLSHDSYDKRFSITAWVKTGIERNLITENRWKIIVDGLGVTMIISIMAQIFGTVLGGVICFMLSRKNRIVRRAASLYCGFIYGTPVVVLLMITYYIIFGNVNISNVLVAIAAFTMVAGASIALNLKGAIGTVDPVEIEAARSIGFSPVMGFITITLPQAVRRALPAYTNGFVELVKATAIVGFIAIQDLTRAGDIIRSRTYDAYFPILFIALIYLLVTTVCVQMFKLIIKKINKGGISK